MVIGLFPSPNHAAVFLSNLAEADFHPSDISIIMKTPGAAHDLAEATGRLSTVPVADLPKALIELGVPPANAVTYRDDVLRGGVFIAVAAAGADDTAKEMFQDHGARNVQSIRDA
jgi:hypothetical protein